MKSYRFFLIVLISFFFISSNAQVFVGGNFNISASGDKTDAGTTAEEKLFDYGFYLSPYAGKFLSDDFAVGIALSVGNTRNQTNDNPETFSKSTSFGVSPFIRYYAGRWNKLSVFAQGQIGLYYGFSKNKTGDITVDGPKTLRTNIEFFPGLSFDLSENFSLLTTLNFFNIGYNNVVTKTGDIRDVESGFNFGAGLSNIITPGSVTIGAIYKF